MLSPFDWIRRCGTGVELLATLRVLAEGGAPVPEGLGPPYSALSGPCRRCWIYPRKIGAEHCTFCDTVHSRSAGLDRTVRQAVIIWGYVSHLPWDPSTERPAHTLGAYAHDPQHFLVMLTRRHLKPWLQDLALQHGISMRGLLQIFPTMGLGQKIGMGDILSRAIHHEANMPHDQLWIRFYSAPYQVIRPQRRDRSGLLTFGITEFLSLLGMAEVFRTVLQPEEQQELHHLLTEDENEEQAFYWGRFARGLDQRARDMLHAWHVRQWPPHKIRVLYELLDYVAPQTYA